MTHVFLKLSTPFHKFVDSGAPSTKKEGENKAGTSCATVSVLVLSLFMTVVLLSVLTPSIYPFFARGLKISVAPTPYPTDEPTGVPTDEPTGVPTDDPTGVPTTQSVAPTPYPTDEPTGVPTDEPTGVPTGVPTDEPTGVPTGVPTTQLLAAELPDAVNEWVAGGANQIAIVAKYGPIGDWDTSEVTEMRLLFCALDVNALPQALGYPFDQLCNPNKADFNEDLSKWDTSKVTGMYSMFLDAAAFNQPLNDWDTSSVTNMAYMFQRAGAFNQPLNDWDTSKVTNMDAMFDGADAFNQNISAWDTSQVTTW